MNKNFVDRLYLPLQSDADELNPYFQQKNADSSRTNIKLTVADSRHSTHTHTHTQTVLLAVIKKRTDSHKTFRRVRKFLSSLHSRR